VLVEAEVSVGAVGRLTLAVLLVTCVRVFEMLLAMLDAPPDPHPATRMVTRPAAVIFNGSGRGTAIWPNAKTALRKRLAAGGLSPR
jgi:hypothetical protein